MRAIATASEEQSATIAEINRSTEQIKQITGEVAAGAQRSSSAVSELSNLSQRLTGIVQELRKS